MSGMTRLCALTATIVLLAACGPAAGEVNTDGAADRPVSLLAVSYNVTGRSGGDQLQRLTELVTQLSRGSVTLVAGPEPDSAAPDTSAEAIKAVRDNRAQLGIVSARTFDTLGVTSFQALQAPYLVTSNELADRVLADPVAETMLQGTDSLGVVGIGLAFDFLAYAGGFGAAVLGPQDYRGQAFQVRPSRANDMLAEALGARSDPRNGPDLEKAVASKEVRGSWGYFDGPSQPVGGEVFTANEPAFARANVIIVNKKIFDGLSTNQQQALRDAAAQTRDWMSGRHTDPAAAAADYCATGGSIVLASDAELDALHRVTAPVISQMQRDPVSAAVIARIRELKDSVPIPTTPVACSGEAATTRRIPSLPASGDQSRIDGVWRLVVDQEALREGGATQVDAANNAGTWTWTFKNGSFRYAEPRGRECNGTYTLSGDKFLAVVYQPPGCDSVLPLVLTRVGDRLRFAPIKGIPTGVPVSEKSGLYTPDPGAFDFGTAFFRSPLVRVGEAP